MFRSVIVMLNCCNSSMCYVFDSVKQVEMTNLNLSNYTHTQPHTSMPRWQLKHLQFERSVN